MQWFLRRIHDGRIYDVERRRLVDMSDIVIEDAGDLALRYSDEAASLEIMRSAARDILKKGSIPMVIGGDHSISWPVIQALHDEKMGPIGLVQFDAHLDLLDENFAQGKFSQSSEIYRAMELEGIDPKNVVQIGVRGYNYPEAYELVEKTGIVQYTPRALREKGVDRCAKEVLERFERAGCKAVYVTLDIDVLDPAFAPGTGADDPDGLFPGELFRMLEIFAPRMDAFDVAEVNPIFDTHGMTAAVAAKAMFAVMVNAAAGSGDAV
jgi:formiminoglutamase/agmatinase